MSEAAQAETTAKKKAEVENVTMADGRVVPFAGKRRVLKETLIDESKVQYDEQSGAVLLAPGAVSVRFDLRNGLTKTFVLPNKQIPKFAGHGGEQKYGDELASPADKPMSEDDMMLALEALDERIQAGDWSAVRESSGGFSGASIVIQAIIEDKKAAGKELTVDQVKTFLNAKIEQHKNDATPLTRQKLYASFRANPRLAAIIQRLEQEKAAKSAGSSVDADAALAEL